jgi:hypothetical protein
LAISKRILGVELTPAIRDLPRRRRQQIGEVISAVRESFGAPHLRSGLGVRPAAVYSNAVSAYDLTWYSMLNPGVPSFVDLGTHDDIPNLIRTLTKTSDRLLAEINCA